MALKVMFDKYDEFQQLVGVLSEPYDFAGLPIQPYVANGAFLRDQLPALLKFVEDNPDYHIVTPLFKGRAKINRFLPHANSWYLAEGDPDPNLVEASSNAWWYAVDIDEAIASALEDLRDERLRKA